MLSLNCCYSWSHALSLTLYYGRLIVRSRSSSETWYRHELSGTFLISYVAEWELVLWKEIWRRFPARGLNVSGKFPRGIQSITHELMFYVAARGGSSLGWVWSMKVLIEGLNSWVDFRQHARLASHSTKGRQSLLKPYLSRRDYFWLLFCFSKSICVWKLLVSVDQTNSFLKCIEA